MRQLLSFFSFILPLSVISNLWEEIRGYSKKLERLILTHLFFHWRNLVMILVYLPYFLPQRDPCEWGSTYWRAAGVLQYWSSLTVLSFVRILENGCFWIAVNRKTAAAKGSDIDANIVLVLQYVNNKMMASTSFRFAVLLQFWLNISNLFFCHVLPINLIFTVLEM